MTAPAELTTRHGRERVAERLGCGRKGAERAIRIARERGTRHADCTGRLRKHLDRKKIGRDASEFIVHGAHLYIFGIDGQLITMHALPPTLRPGRR